MSPRRNRRDFGERPEPDPGAFGVERTEEAPDGDWVVRTIPASNATKPYRCPGCDQEIPPGVPHVVVWPADHGGVGDRRHWHRPCWSSRLTRHPRRRF